MTIRFDATEPQAVNTQVQKQVPLTGANSVVYDQWAKVGQQASNLALDIFEQRDTAAANNYANKARIDGQKQLEDYHKDLELMSTDGLVGGRPINDLMNERAKQMNDEFVSKAPSERAKARTTELFAPIGINAVLSADKLYTKKVAEGSVRRIEDLAKSASAGISPTTEWNEIYDKYKTAEQTLGYEYQNVGPDGVDAGSKAYRKNVTATKVGQSELAISSAPLESDGLNLFGEKVHRETMAVLGKKDGRVAVRNQDGTFSEISKGGATKRIVLSDEKYKNASVVNLTDGEVISTTAQDANVPTVMSSAHSSQEMDSYYSRIYSGIAKRLKQKNDMLDDRIKNHITTVKKAPDSVTKPEVTDENGQLIQATINSNLDSKETADKILSLANSQAGAKGAIWATSAREGIRPAEEDVKKYITNDFNKTVSAAAKQLEAEGRTDDANLLKTLAAGPTYSQPDMIEWRKAYVEMYASNQEAIQKDPIEYVQKNVMPKSEADQRSTLFDFSKKPSERLKELSTSPATLSSLRNTFEFLDDNVANVSGAHPNLVMTASEAKITKNYYLDPLNADTEVMAHIKMMRNTAGDHKTDRMFRQMGLEPWSVGLAAFDSEEGQLAFIQAARRSKAMKDASWVTKEVKDEVQLALEDNTTVQGLMKTLRNSNNIEGANSLNEIMTNMVLNTMSRDDAASAENAANRALKHFLGGKVAYNGSLGTIVYNNDAKYNNDDLELFEGNLYDSVAHLDIVTPAAIKNRAGMTPIENETAYKSSLKGKLFIKQGANGTVNVMVKDTVDGVTTVTPLFVRSKGNKIAPISLNQNLLADHVAIAKAKEADSNIVADVSLGAMSMFFGKEFKRVKRSDNAHRAIGMFDETVATGSMDKTLVNSIVMFEAGEEFRANLTKSQGVETTDYAGIKNLPLNYYKVMNKDGTVANEQILGMIKSWNNNPVSKGGLEGIPSYDSFKARGYKWGNETTQEKAAAIIEWKAARLDATSSDTIDRYNKISIKGIRSLTPYQLKSLQDLGYTQGPSGATGNAGLMQAFKTNNPRLFEESLKKLDNYSTTVSGQVQLNARGKALLGWFRN